MSSVFFYYIYMFVCVQYVAIGDSVKSLFIYWTSESNIGIEEVIRRHNSSFYLHFNKRECIIDDSKK